MRPGSTHHFDASIELVRWEQALKRLASSKQQLPAELRPNIVQPPRGERTSPDLMSAIHLQKDVDSSIRKALRNSFRVRIHPRV